MFSNPPTGAHERLHEARGRLHTRSCRLAAVSATLIVMLAALPTVSALASANSSLSSAGAGKAQRPALSVGRLVTPGELLNTAQLQSLLSAVPLDDLGAAQLAHYLATLQGVSALANLEVLLSGKPLGATELDKGLEEAIQQLKLSNPSATLGELTNPGGLLKALETKLGGLLKTVLGSLLSPGQKTALEGALGSLSLDQLVNSLLSTAKVEELPLKEPLLAKLSTLAHSLFAELNAEEVKNLLGGSQLAGAGEFVPKSVQEVAEELKTTTQAVSKELSGSATELLPETTMLTAPLADGKLAGVAPAVKGLVTGLLGGLGKAPETEGGGGKGSGSGEGKGSGSGEGKGTGGGGGQGGPGGSGSGGSGGTTTVLLTLPGAPSPTHGAAANARIGKIAILSHRVRGRVATIVLHVPAAGTATLSGKGVRGASKQAARAERLTLRVELSRAAFASLRHRRHPLAVKLRASFRAAAGASSSTTATVAFA